MKYNLILIILIVLLFSNSVSATQTISITPLTQNVSVGNAFYIGVNLDSGGIPVQFVHVEVEFPAAYATAVTITYNNLMGGYVAVEPGSGTSSGRITYGISLTQYPALAVNGTLITIQMYASSLANVTIPLNLTNIDIMNNSLNHLDPSGFVITNGSATTSLFPNTVTGSTLFKTLPHDVSFVLQDLTFNKKVGINVTAQGYSTTVGDWAWLSSLIGIDFETIPINNATMFGITGTDGSIDFKMDSSIYYILNFSGTGITPVTWQGYPTQYLYYIIIQTNNTGSFSGNIDQTTISTTVSTKTTNTTHANIYANYSDPLNQTTSLTIYLNISIIGDPNNQTNIQTITVDPNEIYNATFLITPYSDKSYIVTFHTIHSSGTIIRSYGISFPPNSPISSYFNPTTILMLIVGLIFFIAGFFGQTSTEQGSGIIVGFVWILSSMGLFTGLNLGLNFYLGLTLATIITILMNVNARSRREGIS